MASHLIDATEMYLRTIWELGEEGVPPLRARLAERLHVSAVTVGQTVGRLIAEDLVEERADRTLGLTDAGRGIAVSVMRKHRLAERLLADVIHLDWEQVHDEACRWEHVISDAAEAKLVELLGQPKLCPHGNPIPGLYDLPAPALMPLWDAASTAEQVTVARFSEYLQTDVETMALLGRHGLRPGVVVRVKAHGGSVTVSTEDDDEVLSLPEDRARLIFVDAAA